MNNGVIKLNHITDVRKTYLYIVVTNNLPGILDHGSIDEINTFPRILDRESMSVLLASWFSCFLRIGSCPLHGGL